MPTFTGSEFFLESVQQYALATVRVRFTQDPQASNPVGANDALNPSNYALTGPASNAILSVASVFGDPQAVDLFLQQPLAVGAWILTVSAAVAMWDNTTILTPRSMSFQASALIQPEPVNMGALTDTAADVLRKHLNSALRGDAWDALIEAMATGDAANTELAEAAFDQFFKSTASGVYLERKSGDDGLVRPSNLGMPDSLFRQYSIRVTTGKLVENALLDILEVFYGSDSVRAHADSSVSEPYIFQEGDDLTILLDESDVVNVVFDTSDFAVPGVARAAEVAAAITRACRVNGSEAFAVAVTDPVAGTVGVRIYSSALGLASSVRVTGGKAQVTLKFPTFLDVLSGLPTWHITFNAVTNTLRFNGDSFADLSQIRIGDYVTIYGSEFDPGDRGTYQITNVYYAYSPGLVQYFEVMNPNGVADTVSQNSDDSLNFFRPAKQATFTDPARAVIVAVPGDGVDVVLPATSQAVGRGPKQAAYLQGQTALPVTSIKRVNTTVTVACTGHGLSVGDNFFLDSAYSTYTLPATITGSGANLDASLVSIYAATPVPPYMAQFGGAVKLNDGRIFAFLGQDWATNLATTKTKIATVTGPTVLGTGEHRYAVTWISGNAYPGTANIQPHWSVLTDALRSGQVLVTGGEKEDGSVSYNTTYLYTPNGGAGTWTAGPNMSANRARHRQVVLNNGKVLIVGGVDGGTSSTLNSCDLYNPATNTIAATGSMRDTRRNTTLVKLSDGRILAVAGRGKVANAGSQQILWTCEIYDPNAGTWSVTGNLSIGRSSPGAVLLPDGRVLVAGGLSQNATNSTGGVDQVTGDTNTCEIWDPNTGRWSPGPQMNVVHDSCFLFVVGTRVYVMSGSNDENLPDTDNVEWMDLSEMVWHLSPASITPSPLNAREVVNWNNELFYVPNGFPDTGATPTTDLAVILGSETVNAKLNGTWTVASVIDANTFTFTTPDSGYFLSTTGTISSEKAVAGAPGIPGPYAYDPLDGLAVTGTSSTTSSQLSVGHQYAFVDVADATQFPDAEGWLTFGFGYSYQVGPVKYLGRLSATRLALEYSYKFKATVPAGSVVTLLSQKGPWVPEHPESVGSFYATGSAAGRVAAEAAVDAAVAAGVTVNKTITYPGDRGLGGEGLPASGADRLSDKVEVWAGDDVDAEVEGAREE